MKWIGRTTGNRPKVIITLPDGKHLYDVIIEYSFGEMGLIEIDIDSNEGKSQHVLTIEGEDTFKAWLADEDCDPDYEKGEQTEEFLERIQPFLVSNLIIHTIGAEDYNFPLIGEFYIVPTGGTPEDIIRDHLPASIKIFEEEEEGEEEEDE